MEPTQDILYHKGTVYKGKFGIESPAQFMKELTEDHGTSLRVYFCLSV